jgi:hypothetical protein
MKGMRKGRVVVLHLAGRYPFAGVMWQLLHHLLGLRALGLDVYYLEDHGDWVYDPISQTSASDPRRNLDMLAATLRRFDFGERWGFYDAVRHEYLGMRRTRCLDLLTDADAVVNLCGASAPRDEHRRARCLAYIETDPGGLGIEIHNKTPLGLEIVAAHNLFFTYAANIGSADCHLVTGGLTWHPTRPPVLMDQWFQSAGIQEPEKFTTVGTWHNKGHDIEIAGETYYWSKHVNFRNVLDVARRAAQPIELATDLNSGPDYDRALDGGFTFRPVVPMSLDIDAYRQYISTSRGEFTVAKDRYVRTRSGWFSDRSVCYLAAGRPVVTQRTGFEKYVSEGHGLMGFDNAREAVEVIRAINADYPHHARAAREIARDYFDARNLLDQMAEAMGL